MAKRKYFSLGGMNTVDNQEPQYQENMSQSETSQMPIEQAADSGETDIETMRQFLIEHAQEIGMSPEQIMQLPDEQVVQIYNQVQNAVQQPMQPQQQSVPQFMDGGSIIGPYAMNPAQLPQSNFMEYNPSVFVDNALWKQRQALAQARAGAENDLTRGLGVAAGVLQTAGNIMQSVSSKGFATGGNIPIEVEGEEVAERPDGSIYQYIGLNHEQGGIPVQEPAGTRIYSKRLQQEGQSMAQRKIQREARRANAEKYLQQNPTDVVAKKTLKRILQINEKEEKKDMDLQMLLHEMSQGSVQEQPRTFATGGYEPPKHDGKYMNATENNWNWDDPNDSYYSRELDKSVFDDFNNSIANIDGLGPLNRKQVRAIKSMLYGDTKGIKFQYVDKDGKLTTPTGAQIRDYKNHPEIIISQEELDKHAPFSGFVTPEKLLEFAEKHGYIERWANERDDLDKHQPEPMGNVITSKFIYNEDENQPIILRRKDQFTGYGDHATILGTTQSRPFAFVHFPNEELRNRYRSLYLTRNPSEKEKEAFQDAYALVTAQTFQNSDVSKVTRYKNYLQFLEDYYYRATGERLNRYKRDGVTYTKEGEITDDNPFATGGIANPSTPTYDPVEVEKILKAEMPEIYLKNIDQYTTAGFFANGDEYDRDALERTIYNLSDDDLADNVKGKVPLQDIRDVLSKRYEDVYKTKLNSKKFKQYATGGTLQKLNTIQAKAYNSPQSLNIDQKPYAMPEKATNLASIFGTVQKGVNAVRPHLGDLYNMYSNYKMGRDLNRNMNEYESQLTGNVNHNQNYGLQGLATLEAQQEAIAKNLALEQEKLRNSKLQEQARLRNSAQSANTMRALDLAAEAQYQQALDNAYQQANQMRTQLAGQIASAQTDRDRAVMEGEADRDMNNRQQLANTYTQRGKTIANQQQVDNAIAAGYNNIQKNIADANLISKASKYGETVNPLTGLTNEDTSLLKEGLHSLGDKGVALFNKLFAQTNGRMPQQDNTASTASIDTPTETSSEGVNQPETMANNTELSSEDLSGKLAAYLSSNPEISPEVKSELENLQEQLASATDEELKANIVSLINGLLNENKIILS